MKQAKKSWHIWFWVTLLTAITGVASIPGIVLFAINKQFFLMAVCITLAVHAFFGITFYAIAMANASKDVRLIRAINSYGLGSVSDLASATGMAYNSAKECIERCIKRGYLQGYFFDGNTLQRIEPLVPAEPTERRCAYCGSTLLEKEVKCPSCGASVNSQI